MPETSTRTDGAAGEAMDLWRNWLTETERQWNSFFAEVMGRDSFGRVAGSYMEAYSVVQRALNLVDKLPRDSVAAVVSRLSGVEEGVVRLVHRSEELVHVFCPGHLL